MLMNDPSTTVNSNEGAAQALRQFRIVFNAVKSQFRKMERDTGLGGAQVWALSLAAKKPGLGVGEVAQHMHIHQSTASNLVKILLKKELLTSSKSVSDKRAVQLRITPAGRKALLKTPGPFAGVLPHALQRMDADALAALNQSLACVVQLLDADEQAGNILIADL